MKMSGMPVLEGSKRDEAGGKALLTTEHLFTYNKDR
jgi:hypothetical protein